MDGAYAGCVVLNIIITYFKGTLLSYWLSRVITKRTSHVGKKSSYYTVLCWGQPEMASTPYGAGVLYIDDNQRRWHVAVSTKRYLTPPRGYFTSTFSGLHSFIQHDLIMALSPDHRYYWLWISINLYFPSLFVQMVLLVRDRCYAFCATHAHIRYGRTRDHEGKFGAQKCAVQFCGRSAHFATVVCHCCSPDTASNRVRDGHRLYPTGCNCAYKGIRQRPDGIPEAYVYETTHVLLNTRSRFIGVCVPKPFTKTALYLAQSSRFCRRNYSSPPHETKDELVRSMTLDNYMPERINWPQQKPKEITIKLMSFE